MSSIGSRGWGILDCDVGVFTNHQIIIGWVYTHLHLLSHTIRLSYNWKKNHPLPRLKPWAIKNIVLIENLKCWNELLQTMKYQAYFQIQIPNKNHAKN